jgi:FtsZ-binding cell division protein ZapB
MKKKMLNLFKKIFKMATKQELEQQIADAIAVAQKLGAENKQLQSTIESLMAENIELKNDFTSAVERVRYLDGQVRMLESQKTAQTQYSDSDRNY